MEPFELQEKDMAIEVPFRMCVAGASGEKRNREIVFEEIQFLTYWHLIFEEATPFYYYYY